MKLKITFVLMITLIVGIIVALPSSNNLPITAEDEVESPQTRAIYVRTENFPRPPYSGATYYIYEQDGKTICTKLEVCNKFNNCQVDYKKGSFKEEEDVQTGEPYGKTKAVLIPTAKLRKHVCLTRFKLVP